MERVTSLAHATHSEQGILRETASGSAVYLGWFLGTEEQARTNKGNNMTLIKEIEDFDQTQAEKEGWCISYINGGTNNRDMYEIERLDELALLKSDMDAHRIVWVKSKTSPYHYDALRLMRLYCPIEYQCIKDLMSGAVAS